MQDPPLYIPIDTQSYSGYGLEWGSIDKSNAYFSGSCLKLTSHKHHDDVVFIPVHSVSQSMLREYSSQYLAIDLIFRIMVEVEKLRLSIVLRAERSKLELHLIDLRGDAAWKRSRAAVSLKDWIEAVPQSDLVVLCVKVLHSTRKPSTTETIGYLGALSLYTTDSVTLNSPNSIAAHGDPITITTRVGIHPRTFEGGQTLFNVAVSWSESRIDKHHSRYYCVYFNDSLQGITRSSSWYLEAVSGKEGEVRVESISDQFVLVQSSTQVVTLIV
jgi:hypothetical protein